MRSYLVNHVIKPSSSAARARENLTSSCEALCGSAGFGNSSSLRARARGAAAGRDFVGSYLEYHLNFFGKHAKLP